MKLLSVFNNTYLQIFTILGESFNNDSIPEDVLVQAEVARLTEFIEENPRSDVIWAVFEEDTKEHIDDIFNRNETIFAANDLGFLAKINFDAIWHRFEDSEKVIFWKSMITLCRFSAMLKTCGSQLESMEDMASEFVTNNQNKSMDAEECQTALLQELLSGGEMSQKMLKSFQDKNTISNMMSNFGAIMRDSSGGEGGGSSVFSDFMDMSKMMEESDAKKLKKKMKGPDQVEELVEEVDTAALAEATQKAMTLVEQLD